MVQLMNAVMGWRHGHINQRGVSVSVFGSERKRFEEEETFKDLLVIFICMCMFQRTLVCIGLIADRKYNL